MFDKIKTLMEMQKQLQEMKRVLDNTVFDVESPDGLLKVTMNGSQEIKQVVIRGDATVSDLQKLQQAITETVNKAIKRSHELAAQKMKGLSGLNLPGITP